MPCAWTVRQQQQAAARDLTVHVGSLQPSGARWHRKRLGMCSNGGRQWVRTAGRNTRRNCEHLIGGRQGRWRLLAGACRRRKADAEETGDAGQLAPPRNGQHLQRGLHDGRFTWRCVAFDIGDRWLLPVLASPVRWSACLPSACRSCRKSHA